MSRPKILNRFLIRRFLSGVGLVLLVVGGIIFAITFVERLPSSPNAFASLLEAWVRLLEYVPMFLPLSVFMGTLLASYNLTRSTESIIVSSAGLSPYQAARPFLIGALLIGVFATTVINPYSVNLRTEHITADEFTLIDDAIWLRESSPNGFITMYAKDVRVKDNVLLFKKTIVFKQDQNFKLQERVESAEMILSDTGMNTKKATIWDVNGAKKTGSWHVSTKLNPQTVLDRYLQPGQISFWNLPGFIKKMDTIGVPIRAHLVQFWTLLFLPLTMIAMAILGVAFSQTKQRRNYSFGIKFGTGIITCFALYFLINMFTALGAAGTVPPLLAIIAPPLIIIAAAGASIASFDTI